MEIDTPTKDNNNNKLTTDCYVLIGACPTPKKVKRVKKEKKEQPMEQPQPTSLPPVPSTPPTPVLSPAPSPLPLINPAITAIVNDDGVPKTPSPKKRKLTPEERQAREDEKRAKDEEKKLQAKLREEAKKKKEEEKKQKEDERKQQALAREEEKKKKEEERKQREQAKEEARLKREAEKKAKDDAKLQKEQEKKAKEDARILKEEEEKRKTEKKQPTLLKLNFTVSAQEVRKPQSACLIYQYELQADVTMPAARKAVPPSTVFLAALESKGDFTMEALQTEFKGHMRGRRDRKRKSRVELLQGLPPTLSKMKLLRFHDNVRPAYWGTFSKNSPKISGRQPFRTDDSVLDYEVDSDAEWEDEGEGEELSDSEGEKEEKEKEEDEDEEEDEEDKWVVPDGYLSEDEGMDSDDEKNRKAAKEEAEGEESKAAGKRPAEPLEREKIKRDKREKKAFIISTTFDPSTLDFSAKAILQSLYIQPLVDTPIDLDWKPPCEVDDQPNEVRGKLVPDSLMPSLIMYINANEIGLHKLVEGFHTENPQVSKRQVELKIREITIKEQKTATRGKAYKVKEEVMKAFSIPIPVVEVKPPAPKTPQKNMIDFFFKTPSKNPSSTSTSSPSSSATPSSSSTSTSTSATSTLSPQRTTPTDNCHTPTSAKKNLTSMFLKQQKTQ